MENIEKPQHGVLCIGEIGSNEKSKIEKHFTLFFQFLFQNYIIFYLA